MRYIAHDPRAAERMNAMHPVPAVLRRRHHGGARQDRAMVSVWSFAMTYKQFIAYCQRQQRRHIREEQRRMKAARKAWNKYTAAMSALNLHPLSRAELENRDRELARMASTVHETHGDSAAMRATFDMRQEGIQP